jgi:hypothetical protein
MSNWNVDRWIQVYNGGIATLGLWLQLRQGTPTAANAAASGATAVSWTSWLATHYPLALIIAGAGFTLINYLIKRTRSGWKSPELPSEKQPTEAQTDAAKLLTFESFARTFDNPIVTHWEGLVGTEIAKYGPTDREKTLVRFTAAAIGISVFEIAYAQCYGSHLRVLQDLNSRQLTMYEMRPYFEKGYETLKSVALESLTFDSWFGWLLGQNFISQQGLNVVITIAGKEFLKYILSRSYTFDRLG